MNPIVVVGMTALIAAGLYGIYAGLAQQAELGEVQRGMLEAGAAGAAGLRGQIYDDMHILITNDGAQKADIIQIRAYTHHDALDYTWDTDYSIGPYQAQNLTEASHPPLPPAITSMLGSVGPGGTTLRAVTAQGAVFLIDRIKEAGGTAPKDAFGSLAVMRTSPGASLVASNSAAKFEYHYAETEIQCKRSPGPSHGYYLYERRLVYDKPFEISHTLTKTPYPDGSPTLFDWVKLGKLGKDSPYGLHTNYAQCQGSPCIGCDDADGLVPLPDNEFVYYRQGAPADYSVGLRYPISESFEVPHDGRIIVRVEAPLAGHVKASYDFESSETCNDGLTTNCQCAAAAYDPEAVAISLKNSVSAPALSAYAQVASNGAPVGRISLWSGAPASTHDSDSDLLTTVTGNFYVCDYVVSTDLRNSWSYGGAIDGWLEVDAAAGDIIIIQGDVRLSYAPYASHADEITDTYGRLDIGNTIVTTGLLSGR